MLHFLKYLKQVLHEARIMLQDRQFKGLLSLVGILLVLGTLFYSNVEHWSILNAVYFCVITLTTIGYGDVTPHTAAGKIFTMFYAVIGIGVLLGLINVVARHATRRYFRQSEAYLGRTEEFLERIIERTLEKHNHSQ